MTPVADKIIDLLGPDFKAIRFVDVRTTAELSGGQKELTFTSHDGTKIRATYLSPATGNAPALLYCHAHGGRYDIGTRELTAGRPALTAPYGPVLSTQGYAVLCLEMPCFGARAGTEENAAAKARLWEGRTLFGQMLGEQRAGLDWLSAQPGVDASRIGAMGISMGGTLAWWLAALDRRIAAAVSMCCFADMATLIGTSAHDGHGNYMTVPGLLAQCSTGELSGLTAPRPLLHCVGLQDWSTPEPAFRVARNDVEAAYKMVGAENQLSFFVDEKQGHSETEAMRQKVLGFLGEVLAPPIAGSGNL